MIFDAETVVILVLEFLNDVHQMDVGLFDVEVEWVDLLEGVNRLQVQVVGFRDAQLLSCEVNVSNPCVGLESRFVFADPQSSLHFKFIVGQEHPTKLRNELDGVANVVNVLIVEEVAEVETRVAHLNDLESLVDRSKIDVSELIVDTEQLETIHARARATGSCLDAKEVTHQLRHKVWMKNLSIEGTNDEGEDRHLWKLIVTHEYEIRYFQQSVKHLLHDKVLSLMNSFLANLVFQLEYDASPDILQDGRSASLFKLLWIIHVLPLVLIDKQDGATSDSMR